MATEKWLIDANVLLDQFLNRYTEQEKNGKFVFVACEIKQDFADMIVEAPTVDAVEVVRCKDCKYAMDMMPIENSGGYLMGECTLRKEDDIVFTAWGDDFCSYGERKANG